MTAAVSLGSSVQSMGVAAAQALPAVTAGGLHAAGTSAASVASTAVANLPAAIPTAAAGSAQLAADMSVVEKPAKAIAAAVPRASMLVRTTGFLVKALPIVTISASALAGWQIVNARGAQALVTTKEGRGAVLGAAGGAMMLVPHPAGQLAAAGMLGAVAVNHFGGMNRLDSTSPDAPGADASAPDAPAPI